MQSTLSVQQLNKTFPDGQKALDGVDLDIQSGEIFALLGPNGAGKTTLISIICGLVNPTSGRVLVDGHDIISSYRQARNLIGLVPQELATNAFESVISTVEFSRGLFGLPSNSQYVEKVLRDLSLWDKRNARTMSLSGGMKRRLMIAKALAHEPRILFLDEPTAGVDVELRRDMWNMVRGLRDTGVTIILTTHYIEEAEEMADRIGVINQGRIILVEDKTALMTKLGRKHLNIVLQSPLDAVPSVLGDFALTLTDDGHQLVYAFDTQSEETGISDLLQALGRAGLEYRDLNTQESSLEEIFVNLVHAENGQTALSQDATQ